MDLVKDAVRQVAASVPVPDYRNTVLSLEPEALQAVRFLMHCTVHRAYATVERISGKDGVVRPVVLVKAELRFKGPQYAAGRRTVIVGLAPTLVQLLRSMKWTGDWAERLELLLRDPLAKRMAELDGEIRRHVDALKGDPDSVAKIQGRAQEVVSKEREKLSSEMRSLVRLLVLHGWTKEDVLREWDEAMVRDVHES